MQAFDNIQALIIDMDGVLWHGEQAVPGLIDFFAVLRAQQLPFILATNNASLTVPQYVDKFARMGVTISANEVLTSGTATALHLANNHDPKSTRLFVIGGEGATEPLLDQGFTLTGLLDIKVNNPELTADIVVCGLDRQLTWDKLATATINISAGALFIGTNGDTTLPTEGGSAPGNGATLAAIEAATGVKATTIGKPGPILYQQALALLGVDPDATIAIGDRLDTDILGAANTGIRSLMVLTGVSNEQDIDRLDYGPTWIMQDICAITAAITHLNQGN
jgi:4-nitrophenyl phosphatase